MGITVIFSNGNEAVVPSYVIDYLIKEKKIIAFQRTDGWVRIGQDPIRRAQQPIQRPGARWNDFLYKRS